MGHVDYYAANGYALELLAKSKYHRQHALGNYFRAEILPAIWNNQVQFYLTTEGIPTAMVTWAWVSAEVQADVHSTGRSLMQDEWRSGDRLFFNDWVTPYNNIREIVHDMTHNIFPNEIATSLRRNMDGAVRRVNRWTGVQIRNAEKGAVACARYYKMRRILRIFWVI